MFQIFIFVFSGIIGALTYRLLGGFIDESSTPLTARSAVVTKLIISFVTGLLGFVLATILYGALRFIIPIAIIVGIPVLLYMYWGQIKDLLKGKW